MNYVLLCWIDKGYAPTRHFGIDKPLGAQRTRTLHRRRSIRQGAAQHSNHGAGRSQLRSVPAANAPKLDTGRRLATVNRSRWSDASTPQRAAQLNH
jgi:hypothetical protein